MKQAFQRTELLLGGEAMERLAQARVAVFGIGGVGGHAVEALARSGVGAIDLVDNDVVSESNLNRQMVALIDTIGQYKTEVARNRIASIHPACKVTEHRIFYLPETAEQIELSAYDYIIDAIDTISAKLALAELATAKKIPVISAMGAGNKLDPTAFRVADIYDTAVCPLARVMRRELKKRGIRQYKVIYSEEPPRTPLITPELAIAPSRKPIPASCAFVPSVVGLLAASVVIKELAGIA